MAKSAVAFDTPVALLFATSGHSGVDRVVANLLPEFAQSSYSFDLLQLKGHGPYLDSVPDNITVNRLPGGSKRAVLPALALFLRRRQPRVLLTANHPLNRAALLARRLAGARTRVCIRMGMSLTAKGAGMKARDRDALFASMRRWYPLADAVIAPSDGVGEDLRNIARVSRDRLHVIRNPIVTRHFDSLSRERPDHPWLSDPDCPVILSVGSLEPRKDFSTLIRAFADIRARQACRLIVLGEGKEREGLLRLAKELGVERDVDLPGFVRNPYPYMRTASVFVLSSRREGASAVLVEALACGTPVVSTDCPSGPAETLQNGRVGSLVPVGDPEAMARAVHQTLKEPPRPGFLREAISEHRAEFAAERYLLAMGIGREGSP